MSHRIQSLLELYCGWEREPNYPGPSERPHGLADGREEAEARAEADPRAEQAAALALGLPRPADLQAELLAKVAPKARRKVRPTAGAVARKVLIAPRLVSGCLPIARFVVSRRSPAPRSAVAVEGSGGHRDDRRYIPQPHHDLRAA